MTIKLSITVTEPAHAFAKAQVADGRYPNMSAAVNAGLTRLREDEEERAAALLALTEEIRRRAAAPSKVFEDFDPEEERRRTEAVIEQAS